MLDKKKLALIHIIKRELNLGDSEYRRILLEATGVNSAKDLDEKRFKKLMRYFVHSNYYRINPLGLTIKQKLYIRYLLKDLAWSLKHLNNFIRKYYHKPDIDSLSRKEAIKLIESLKAIREHQLLKN
ncbi:MAG: regulatory protein GemA [Candidatus Omnitrophica bacterium]|nr:regulatory protein GemA [Candidatus Omnitrophota bacterium]